MCMSLAWHQMIQPMLSTTFCPCYGCGTRWCYPCCPQYAWHSVYGLRTNEDCRGSHRLQLKKQLQGTWSVSCSAWIGCIHSNKTQICFQTSSIVHSSQNQLQCLQQQKHSCHGKDSKLEVYFWCHCLRSCFNHFLLWLWIITDFYCRFVSCFKKPLQNQSSLHLKKP
jgi:hypothetical protein